MRSIEILQENDEHEVLKYLTEFGHLEGAAHGIALQVLARGRESLTEKQEYVFQRFVADKFFRLECALCHGRMPTCEVVYALGMANGMCSWCSNMVSKDD